jgi:hypothetical protein
MSFGIVYGVILILSLPLTAIRTKWNYFLYSSLIVILIGIAAYYSYPTALFYSDSIRFDLLLDNSRAYEFLNGRLDWFLTSSEYSNQPLISIFLWLISFFSDNGMLRLITIVIFLFVIIQIINETGNIYNISYVYRGRTFVAFLGLFNIYYQIAGIRNFLSFSIFSYGIVLWFLAEKKIRGISVILLCFFIHNSSLLPIGVFFIFIFLNKKMSSKLKWILLGSQFLLPYIFQFLMGFNSIPLVAEILRKANNYLYSSDNFETYASSKQILFTSVLFLFCVFSIFVFNVYFKKYGELKIDKFNSFVLSIVFLCLGNVLNTQIYLRLIQMTLFLSLPLILIMINKNDLFKFPQRKNLYLEVLWGISIIVFPIVMYILWYNVQYFKIYV